MPALTVRTDREDEAAYQLRVVSFTHKGVLVAIAVVATALAPWFFSRRDVAT